MYIYIYIYIYRKFGIPGFFILDPSNTGNQVVARNGKACADA